MSDSTPSDAEKYVHDGTLLTRNSYHHEQLKHSASSISGSSSACRSGGKCSFLKVFDPETATACFPPGAEWTERCQVVYIETSRPLGGDSTSFAGQTAGTR